jgi:hypothetical protein
VCRSDRIVEVGDHSVIAYLRDHYEIGPANPAHLQLGLVAARERRNRRQTKQCQHDRQSSHARFFHKRVKNDFEKRTLSEKIIRRQGTALDKKAA